MIVHKCACEKSYISNIITFITQASLKYLQELGTFLAPQNRTQGRCELLSAASYKKKFFLHVLVFTLTARFRLMLMWA